jgi:tight adherence protein B
MTPLIVTLMAGAGVALMLFAAYSRIALAVDVVEQRLGRYAGLHASDIPAELKRTGTSLTNAVNKFVDRQSFADRIRSDLQRADLRLTPGEFVFARMGVIALGGFLAYEIFDHQVIPALGVMVLMFFAPRMLIKRRIKARERHFAALLGDAVLMMASSLRAGHSMMQALETVSKEMGPPICEEFQRVTREVAVGISVEDALKHLTLRIKSVDLELMTVAMNVQREVGGNLAAILDTIGATIRERQELYGEVRTLTAQGRISAYVISFMPVALGVIMYLLNPHYIATLWTTMPGYFMSGIAITMIIVGFFVTRKVAMVEV